MGIPASWYLLQGKLLKVCLELLYLAQIGLHPCIFGLIFSQNLHHYQLGVTEDLYAISSQALYCLKS